MKSYLIERDVPGIGDLSAEAMRDAAARSNAALAQLGPRVQWVESFVAGGTTFCRYRAEDEAVIHEHARLSGFPVSRITEIRTVIDPTTATA
ncbi:MAG: DUF4242 domain-containing protein [Sphingobium sp.]|nr:MAG: DUF4242 domain-containing protein [Sphingobium sp.]